MKLTPLGISFDSTGKAIEVLAIGLPSPVASALANGGPVHSLSVAQLARAPSAQLAGAVCACPLMAGDTDALCVIDILEAAGFQGTLLVIAPPLPNPAMVERELRQAAKTLSLRLLSL